MPHSGKEPAFERNRLSNDKRVTAAGGLQSYYVLESEGQKMIFWGDIIHVPDIQFADPNVTIKFDVDSTAAAVRRKKDFADAVKNRSLVAMPHMYFPGVGHVAKDGNHYRWIPLPYVNDAKPASGRANAAHEVFDLPDD